MIIGIDPGLSGAISVITNAGDIVEVYDTPIVGVRKGKRTKNEYNIIQIKKILMNSINLGSCTAALEKMQSLPPGIRIQASFSLGYSQGVYEGLLSGLSIPYELVVPKTWQKSFQISKNKGDTKSQSILIASKLFPEAELFGPRGGRKDGRADALLIAEFGRRKLKGDNFV